MALPSVKQMKVRAMSGHKNALEAIRDGKPVAWAGSSLGEIRGYRTVLSTLRRWECITEDGITERGEQLLEAMS